MLSKKRSKTTSLFLSALMVFIYTFTALPSFANEVTEESIAEDVLVIDLDEITDSDLKTKLRNKEITEYEYDKILELKETIDMQETNNIPELIEENDNGIQPQGVGTFLTINYIVFKYISGNVVVKLTTGYVVGKVVDGIIVGVTGYDITDEVAKRVSNTIRGRKYHKNTEIVYNQSWKTVHYGGKGSFGGGSGGGTRSLGELGFQ